MRTGSYRAEECKFVRCEITGLRSTHSSVQSLDFEDCRLQEIEWAPLMSNGAFPDPIHTLKECSLKYNTFTEMNFNRFDFSDGNEIVGSMFAKCEMQLGISRTWNFTKRNSTSVTCARRISGMPPVIRWTFWAAPEGCEIFPAGSGESAGRFEDQAVVRRRKNASTHHCTKRSADVSR